VPREIVSSSALVRVYENGSLLATLVARRLQDRHACDAHSLAGSGNAPKPAAALLRRRFRLDRQPERARMRSFLNVR
jgi:hypothetical protein